jgi:hypothetical protein
MKLALAAILVIAVPVALAAATTRPQTKWKPFQFRGDERYDYTLVMDDGSGPKETGFGLDIRKKADAGFDVTWSIRSTLAQEELNEQTLLVGWASAAPAWTIMNPMYAMFVNDLELKEGEKMSVFGAGTVKVTGKETIGGRTGFTCQFLQKDGDKEKLVWEWTVDPELALPIKSISHDGERETSRAVLTAYAKD